MARRDNCTERSQMITELTRDDFRLLKESGVRIEAPTLAQTLGPLWKHLYRLNGRYHVCPDHTPRDVKKLLTTSPAKHRR